MTTIKAGEEVRPEDVPEELVKVANAHYSMHGHGLVRNILAGVLTEAGRTDRVRWQELRQQVQQARDDYDEAANDHGDMTGHEAQQERAFGRVEALDEVLGMLAEGERQEQLAADLGTHADLADPVHGSGAEAVFSRIDANWETEAGSL